MGFFWLILLALVFFAFASRGREHGRMDWTWILLLLIGLPLLAGGWMMGGGMMGGWGHMRGWGHMGGWGGGAWGPWATGSWAPWLMLAGWIVGAALLGGLVYLLFKRMPAPESEARQILRLRLAKGEITADEYDLLAKKVDE